MARGGSLYATSIGKKLAMAFASLFLVFFIIAHLWGNLKVFAGPEKFNHYGEFLRVMGAPMLGTSQALWLLRIVLLAAVLVHIVAYLQLWRQSRAARRQAYKKYDPEVFSYASKTMKWGGIAILLFVVYHILHFTTGTVHPEFMPGLPYENLVIGLSSWPVALFYILAVLALGLHLYHGTWSALQTFGFTSPKYNHLRRPIALGFSVLITLGYISIPVAVLAGFLE